MHLTIFANGELPPPDINLEPNTQVVAVNGGARHCLSLGIHPDVVIGDFDSFSLEEVEIVKNRKTTLLRYPTSKDETDLELALNFAVDSGAADVVMYGLLGNRWDMSFSNILLLSSTRFNQINFFVESGNTSIRVLRGGTKLFIQGNLNNRVSIIPLSRIANGISIQGLEWSLDDESLEFGSQRGLSNKTIKKLSQVSLKSGILLVIIDRELSSSKGHFSAVYSE